MDTAWSYDHGGYGLSQRQMGLAIKNFTAATRTPRSAIFVTTKIPCGSSGGAVRDLIQYDLDQLMLPFVDLILIHTPGTCKTPGDLQTTWQGMQAAQKAKLTRAIGLSNFGADQITAILSNPATTIRPAVNQCLLHVGHHDDQTINFCTQHGIAYQAYSALGHPNGGGKAVYDLPLVLSIAKAHNVTGAQVGLRWLVQQGHPFVTASGVTAYDSEDLDVFAFNLTAAEMKALTALKELE